MKPIWCRVFCAVFALLLLGAVSVTFADEAFQPINRDCTLDWEGFAIIRTDCMTATGKPALI